MFFMNPNVPELKTPPFRLFLAEIQSLAPGQAFWRRGGMMLSGTDK